MSSEPKRLAEIQPTSDEWGIGKLANLGDWRARMQRVAEWEAANPELSAAWSEAIRENHVRDLENLNEREEGRFSAFLDQCGVGERTIEALENPATTPALTAAEEWLATKSTFLLFLGRAGVGKTVAAARVLYEARLAWTEEGVVRWRFAASECLFVKASKLSRSVFTGDGEMFERASRVRWLVMDELGGEYADQHGRWLGELDALLDARYENRRRTVITTNLPATEFKERYGERITSRIRGDGRIVDCGSEDLRARRTA